MRVSERGRWALVVLAAAIALVALDAWWIATYRHGYPLDIDEAGYTAGALSDYFSLEAHGFHGWWDTIQATPAQAPLVPALASLVMVVNQGILQGFVVLAGFLVVLTMAVYGIADRLAGPRLGALAAIVAATSQGVFMFAHQFVFALPAAALLSCAVYSLLRSEGMQRTCWALACGAAIGLMLLARTMTVVFVPGLAAAALVALALRPRRQWLPGALNTAAASVAAFAVAATWYWRNLGSVVDYLTNYGYGEESGNFGTAHSVASWAWWHAVASRIADSDLLVPLGAVVLAGLVAVALAAVSRIWDASDRRGEALLVLRSDAASVAIVFAAGYLALSTSRNGGVGFTLPITVLLVPLAVIALRLHRRAAVPVISLLAVIALANGLANSNVSEGLSRQRTTEVPGLGSIHWIDGVTTGLEDIRTQSPGPETRFAERDRLWPKANDALTRYIVERLGGPFTALGSRNRIINTNSVNLALLEDYHEIRIPQMQLFPREGNDAAEYRAALNDPTVGLPGAVVTIRPNTGDYEPRVNEAAVEAAARSSGFHLVHTIPLPNGTQARIWARRPAVAESSG